MHQALKSVLNQECFGFDTPAIISGSASGSRKNRGVAHFFLAKESSETPRQPSCKALSSHPALETFFNATIEIINRYTEKQIDIKKNMEINCRFFGPCATPSVSWLAVWGREATMHPARRCLFVKKPV
jgi:hypothetical protein